MIKFENKKIMILGERWTINSDCPNNDELLKICDGRCDWSKKEIVISTDTTGNIGDVEKYYKKVTRHEVIHAYLYESGLAENSNSTDAWAYNEEMVDWFARMMPKIYKTFEELEVVND